MSLLLSSLLLLTVVGPSQQVTYSCNSTATCGCSTYSAVVTKIVGGETASPATWSWAVSLLINRNGLCGGSILSSSWILTAAHCAVTASEIIVSAGSNIQLGGSQVRTAAAAIWHPDYDPDTMVNDIALLRLSTPLNMSDSGVATICLPASTTEIYPTVGSSLVAVGWGDLIENGTSSETLQQVTLNAVSYQDASCRKYINDTSKQFCAGVLNSGKDTCQGDSGGPLMLFTSNVWFLAGVTSFGDGCAQPNISGVYTRVTAYLNWIYATTNITATTTWTNMTLSTTIGTNTTSVSAYHRAAPVICFLTIFVLSFSGFSSEISFM